MAQPTYEKYDPIVGGFKARLGASLPITNGGFFGLVSLDAFGKVIAGAGGQTGPVGVVIKNLVRQPVGYMQSPPGDIGDNFMQNRKGDAVDVMQIGEIAGADKTIFALGKKVYANPTTGAIDTTPGTGKYLVGVVVDIPGRIRITFLPGTPAQA